MNGVIEISTGNLVQSGFCDFTPGDGQAVRNDVPYPSYVFGLSDKYHRWTGSSWTVVNVSSDEDFVSSILAGSYTYREPSEWPGNDFLIRLAPHAYEDGEGVPPETGRPNPREISNAIFDNEGVITNNDLDCTDMFWLWGQFLDHDIDLTSGNVSEPMPIVVPTGDPEFDPESTGTQTIAFTRSNVTPGTGHSGVPRQQINAISSLIDCTNIYGTDEERSTWLRTGVKGSLKTSQGNLPPLNDTTQHNEGPGGDNAFLVGDVRGNENVALLSIHTLLLREHNYWANKIYLANPALSDDEIYNRARVIVESEAQHITFNEFLPLLLGDSSIPAYTGYNNSVDVRIANEFSTAGFRLGHSLVSDLLWRLDSNNNPLPLGHLELKDAFFSPSTFANEGGIDPILQGVCRHLCKKLDHKVVTNLRNFLFGNPGEGGHDLVALNIQRGRDHGIPDYNTVRVALSLGAKATFADITSDGDLASDLSALYGGDISKVDLFAGGLCEDRVPGSQLGELFHTIVLDQFVRLRDGDPMWYETRLSGDALDYVRNVKISDILKRNTNVKGIQDYAMKLE